jgi:FkbM family methyltransferase
LNIRYFIKQNLHPKRIHFLRKYILGYGDEKNFSKQYYSQAGEDIILKKIFSLLGIQQGFFIDVGAYHPFDKSNTYLLSRDGWKGINIEPNPTKKNTFDIYRKNDINLPVGIAATKGMLTYYIIDEHSTMNTFSKENLAHLQMVDQITQSIPVQTFPLQDIIDNYLPQNATIDFLNIDAEGYEMEILETIDWHKNKPTVIALEQGNLVTLKNLTESHAYNLLASMDYEAYARAIVLKDVSTVFYVQKQFL